MTPRRLAKQRAPTARWGGSTWSARPLGVGFIVPRWWVMMVKPGSLSNRPEKTMRAIATLVSYGQPRTCHISNFDLASLG
jgi:hypothetical protein